MKMKIDVSDGKNVFFISDFHLFHKNVVKFDNRPFVDKNGEPDMLAMNKTIIKNWNDTVNENDIVFYLGDLVFGRIEWANQVIHALNGEIHYILGNHDKYEDIKSLGRFKTISDYIELNILGDVQSPNLHFCLMHYPVHSWNRAHHGSYMIHGHCHMSLSDKEFHQDKRIYDVGCNGWDYTPIEYHRIVKLGEKVNYKINTHH